MILGQKDDFLPEFLNCFYWLPIRRSAGRDRQAEKLQAALERRGRDGRILPGTVGQQDAGFRLAFLFLGQDEHNLLLRDDAVVANMKSHAYSIP